MEPKLEKLAHRTYASWLVGVGGATLFSLLVGQVIPGVPRPVQIVIRILVLYLAIVVHEVSHGYVAYLRGDPTAKQQGRLTLNPVPHIDLFGSIIIPAFLILTNSSFIIGWAKPVPVDIRRFREPLKDFAITSLAGPASNFIQVGVYTVIFKLATSAGLPNWVGFLAFSGAAINLFLGFFNLIPIPPLDGSRLVAYALPTHLAVQYLSIDRFGFIIVFGLLWLGAFDPIFGALWHLLMAILS
ncbi:MAG: site-2 protease family protein [Candidatus Eisenbacteria bacterium]